MTRLNRLFQLINDENCRSLGDWDGNSFPNMVENVIESTPFLAEGFDQAGQVFVARLRAMMAWPNTRIVRR